MPNQNFELISIVTPTFNSEKTIAKTCESILEQNDSNFEHIIVDNLSSDGTVEIIKSIYQKHGKIDCLKIYQEKDSGISDAFNKGITKAQGDIIAILNSDDHYLNNSIFKTVRLNFKQNSNALVVHGDLFFDDPVYGAINKKPLNCKIEEGMPIHHPTCFIKKEAYQKYGLFDLKLRYAMDFEWFARFYQKDSPLFSYAGPDLIAYMYGDGTSGQNEIKALKEEKVSLLKNNRWNFYSAIFHYNRLVRLYVKHFLSKYNIHAPIKIWRSIKWHQ